jgi:hypothetical protein
MGKDSRSMERADPQWQLVLLGKHLRMLLLGFLMMAGGVILMAAPQHFTVAIPAMEGPLTMGIFSEQGELVRLLYRDAPVENIPAGLNGLIMSWDGKNDQGTDVPSGIYRARGLVHGPIRVTQIPFFTPVIFPLIPGEEPTSPLPANRIVLRAADDELLESRPLLSLHALKGSHEITLEAEGLPLMTIPLIPGVAQAKVHFKHGPLAGEAALDVEGENFQESYLILGLDRIVPIDAGKLEISGGMPVGSADASHPAMNAGESAP